MPNSIATCMEPNVRKPSATSISMVAIRPATAFMAGSRLASRLDRAARAGASTNARPIVSTPKMASTIWTIVAAFSRLICSSTLLAYSSRKFAKSRAASAILPSLTFTAFAAAVAEKYANPDHLMLL